MSKKNTAAAKIKAPAKPRNITAKKATVLKVAPAIKPVISEDENPGIETPAMEIAHVKEQVIASDENPIVENLAVEITPVIEQAITAEANTVGYDEPSESGISVVIPYLASAASGDELLYALRAWDENFPGCRIVIIGDRPDFISDRVLHIPAIVNFKSPQLDVTAKLLQAIASDLVSEDFILSNDDIYPVNPIELADIADLKCAGFLGSTKKNANPAYSAKIFRTMELLQSRKLPYYDYSTHTPFLFNKTRLGKVIARYKADQEPLLVSSLYFNTCFPKDVPEVIKGGATGDLIGYVYRKNPNIDILEEAFLNRKFINHNSEGYAAVLPFLETFFPDKSRFEN